MKTKRDGRKDYPLAGLLTAGLLIAVLLSMMGIYYHDINDKLLTQAKYNLSDNSRSSKLAFDQLIQNRLYWLSTMANLCDLPDGSGHENWRAIMEVQSVDGMRFGVADIQGLLYYDKDRTLDISDQEYFQKAAAGEVFISDPQRASTSSEDKIVLAVPLEKDGSVQGVICAEISTLALGRSLNEYNNLTAGATLVFSPDGQLVSSYEGMELYPTIYEMLKTMKYEQPDAVNQMEQSVRAGESGFLTYTNQGQLRLLTYEPAGIKDWYICSLVVVDVHEKILMELSRNAVLILAGVVLDMFLLGLNGFYLIRFFMKRNQEAQKDPLTGIYTRQSAGKLISRSLKRTRKRDCACLFLDIDNFKIINDTLGHDGGDQILIQVGRLLRESVRGKAVVSRYGGDEFTVWLDDINGETEAAAMAERFLSTLEKKTSVQVSIGIAIVDPQECDYNTILKRADQALYQAKLAGKNQYRIADRASADKTEQNQ